MNDFRVGTIVWGSVVAILIICVTIGCVIGNEQSVRNDKQCLDAGKSVIYEAHEGTSNTNRECK